MKGRIEIKSLEEGLKDFRATWKAVAAGKKISPLVTFAETVSVRIQDRKGFLDLLDRALAFDARSAAPEDRMGNLVSQHRAHWLKGRVDELFLD